MAEHVSNLQKWQQEMDQQIARLHTAVENSQLRMTQLRQAQVETQRVIKDQNDGIMKILESLQKQVA